MHLSVSVFWKHLAVIISFPAFLSRQINANSQITYSQADVIHLILI